MKEIILSIITTIAIVFGTGVISKIPGYVIPGGVTNQELPRVQSVEHLKELLSEVRTSSEMYEKETPTANNAQTDGYDDQSSTPREYSETNIQVEGVDESDIVKTDGNYIYQLTDKKLVISKVYPIIDMAVKAEIKYDNNMYPLELYIDEDYIIVIATEYINESVIYEGNTSSKPLMESKIYYPRQSRSIYKSNGV